MRVRVRCYAELNDHLPRPHRYREVDLELAPARTLGELLDGRGIPVAEVEVALVNGVSCALDRVLRDGDRVSLYPVFEAMDVTALLRLRTSPLRGMRFVADAHLGRLARYLRLLGFDTLFENDPGDEALVQISEDQQRILLSRDRALLSRRCVTRGLWIPSTRPRQQLAYVVERLDLYPLFRPFTRCTLCNGELQRVSKSAVGTGVPPRVRAVFERFWRCEGCQRIYWQGSHYQRLRAMVKQLVSQRKDADGGD
jgi:uncharacterized protein with PIN domain